MEKEIKHRKSIRIIAICILLIVVFILYGRYINTSGLKVHEYAVYHKNLPAEYNGFKIAHFSDIHFGRTTSIDDLNKVKDSLNELKADVVIFTGDLFDKSEIDKQEQEKIIKILKSIEARLFKFASIGDYDQKYLDSYKNIMDKSEFILLDNENKLVYDDSTIPINFVGITNTEKTDNLYTDNFNITIMHKPDYIKNLKNTNIAFAGHSMGGQLVFPFLGGIIKKDGAKTYINSYYKINNQELYISNGIGTENISFRIFNKPSITLYRLYKK